MKPEMVAKLVAADPPKTFVQRLKEMLAAPRSAYLKRQDELREKAANDAVKHTVLETAGEVVKRWEAKLGAGGGLSKVPSAHPVPLIFDPAWTPSVSKYDQIVTWRGKPLTPTQMRYVPAPEWWVPAGKLVGIPAVIDGMKVFGEFEIEEWNDMEEDERVEQLKIRSLNAYGIPAPLNEAVARAQEERMERKAKVAQLAADMEAHKEKLKRELAEAEEREKAYEGNVTFGAF